MKISLVMATIGRTWEVERLLTSLEKQTYKNFEVIIVDQNNDDRLNPIIEKFKDSFFIKRIKSEKGLSRARNKGLKHISGDIVAFPDDDCWYPKDLLYKVFRFFCEHPSIDGLTGRSVNEYFENSAGNFQKNSIFINRYNVWNTAISFTIFVRRKVTEKIFFDEMLGVGANTPFGSGEETDFLLRCLNNNFKLYYDFNLIVHHPDPLIKYDKKAFERAFSYGCGFSKVLKKHKYHWLYISFKLFKPLAGALLFLLLFKFGKAKFYFYSFKGRLKGILL
ncbi:glycosyltransferase family 2 protein [Geobacillus stearothermophilus]|uniref:glycosyltransferase family 2 protein n=1 Tax=Anoxybacillaceae TaxID=3120669 RepID=UPI000EF5C2A8|nr:glycosyltransferase family 2 protein [Geobacillus stearothermophilus]RLP97561.1 glycosyltransferase family 2 protein [Geobacillus stearothermophilus]